MPSPKRLQQLLKRLSALETHLLPASFSLTGRYSAQQNDLTKAYLLLAHAELEAYFEDRARHRVDLAQARWQRSGTCSPVLSRLLVYHHALKDQLHPISSQAVTRAVSYYLNRLENNHGIRERNLLRIFLPLGVNHTQLDSRLIHACNQLSQKRGEFAHMAIKTHQQVDPKTERDNIRKNIIPELKRLDLTIKRLR